MFQNLYLLVTDQGFLKEPSVVWETLSGLDGNGQFVDQHFVERPAKVEATASSHLPHPMPEPSNPEQQVDQE